MLLQWTNKLRTPSIRMQRLEPSISKNKLKIMFTITNGWQDMTDQTGLNLIHSLGVHQMKIGHLLMQLSKQLIRLLLNKKLSRKLQMLLLPNHNQMLLPLLSTKRKELLHPEWTKLEVMLRYQETHEDGDLCGQLTLWLNLQRIHTKLRLLLLGTQLLPLKLKDHLKHLMFLISLNLILKQLILPLKRNWPVDKRLTTIEEEESMLQETPLDGEHKLIEMPMNKHQWGRKEWTLPFMNSLWMENPQDKSCKILLNNQTETLLGQTVTTRRCTLLWNQTLCTKMQTRITSNTTVRTNCGDCEWFR